MMHLFRRSDHTDNVLGLCDELDAALDQFDAEVLPITTAPHTILDRSASLVSAFLDEARSEKVRLETEIRGLQERLRQTCVAIEAFEPTLIVLDDGYDAKVNGAKSYEVAISTKRKRGDKHYSKPALVAQAAE